MDSENRLTEKMLDNFDFVKQVGTSNQTTTRYISKWDVEGDKIIFSELPTYEEFLITIIKIIGETIRNTLMEEIQEHFK